MTLSEYIGLILFGVSVVIVWSKVWALTGRVDNLERNEADRLRISRLERRVRGETEVKR